MHLLRKASLLQSDLVWTRKAWFEKCNIRVAGGQRTQVAQTGGLPKWLPLCDATPELVGAYGRSQAGCRWHSTIRVLLPPRLTAATASTPHLLRPGPGQFSREALAMLVRARKLGRQIGEQAATLLAWVGTVEAPLLPIQFNWVSRGAQAALSTLLESRARQPVLWHEHASSTPPFQGQN